MKDDTVSSFMDYARLQIATRKNCVVLVGHHVCFPSQSDKQCRECYDKYIRGDDGRVDK